MAYQERALGTGQVVLWERTPGLGTHRTRILPDGCMDVIWDGRHLMVAGPDRTARLLDTPAGVGYVGVRLHAGTGPALLGLPAGEVCDREVPLDDVWSPARVRTLSERVAEAPSAVLGAWVVGALRDAEVDPLGPRVHAMAHRLLPVADMAARLGMSPRNLHRRCLPVFGYGPRRLARILRMGRALTVARSGVPLSRVAAEHGYADQAHLTREMRELAAATPTSLLAESRGQGGEEVDRPAVGVPDDGVPHAPERVEGR